MKRCLAEIKLLGFFKRFVVAESILLHSCCWILMDIRRTSYSVLLWYPDESVEILLYMAKCIEKITKEQFSYDKKATWDRVKLCEISLPITSDGGINFDYMVRYIHAIEKLAIADVVKYKDKLIATTKQVVGM